MSTMLRHRTLASLFAASVGWKVAPPNGFTRPRASSMASALATEAAGWRDSIDQLLDRAAPFEEVPQDLTLDFREGTHRRRPLAPGETDLAQERGAGGDDRRLLVGDQAVAAARAHRVDRAGNGVQLASDGDGGGRGQQRPGAIGRLDDDDRLGEARDDPVASREVRPADRRADGDLAHQRAAAAQQIAGERPMPGRVDAVDRRREDRDAGRAGGHRRAVRRTIDAEREPRNDHDAGP